MSTSLQESSLGSPVLTEVSDGVFAYVQPNGSWWINNTGLLVGPHGAVGIDACATEARTRAYLDSIRSVMAAPARTSSTPITTAITPMAAPCSGTP